MKSGQVIMVEPGFYDLGRGGGRIEDGVLVTKTGCELLPHLPYTFEILPPLPRRFGIQQRTSEQ